MAKSAEAAKLLMSRVCRVPGSRRPAPTLFHYPGLTARPTHSRDHLPFASWVRDLEAATPAIRAEYLRLHEQGRPSDYNPEDSDHGAGLHTGGEWHWASLVDRGEPQKGMLEQCPETAAALTSIPDLCVGDMPFAFAFFSTLRPQCRIAAHTAPSNLRVRVHLPLIVPEPEVRARDEKRNRANKHAARAEIKKNRARGGGRKSARRRVHLVRTHTRAYTSFA
jgi:aspartyl/asparaginyl beta-hydroxylase (cupin superfamily)|tara:strand:+ start:135 stop:800 length:666 start_codon:yes stop_codon:yes gene_type:complete